MQTTTDASARVGRRAEGGTFRNGAIAGLVVVIMLYVGSALVIPIHQDFPIVDEPIYAEPALEYSRTGGIEISAFAAPNAVVETVVGGLFARVLGEDLGVLRLSAMIVTAISAPFMYLLCRALGASRHLSVLGTAVYLFTPLAFTITHVFHTDPFAMAIMVISAGSLTAALANWQRSGVWLWMGSTAMAIGYLSRPQLLIVPAAALLVWFRWGESVGRWRSILALAIPSIVVVVAHTIWTNSVGEPFIRGLSRQDLFDRSLGDALKVLSETMLTAGVYIGLFVLPFAPLLVIRWGPLFRGATRRVAVYTAAALVSMAAALAFAGVGPFDLQAWISNGGLGGVDRSHLGTRSELPFLLLATLTLVLYASAYLLAMRTLQGKDETPNRIGLRFIVILAIGFAASVVISSIPLHAQVLDRYWLPLVPLSIAIGVSHANVFRLRLRLAWVLASAIAAISFIGTYDAFVVYREVNEYAAELLSEGIDPLTLEAGASWAGAYFGLQDEDPAAGLSRLGPFWVRFYAIDSHPVLGIALSAVPGYEVVERRPYDSLLHPGTQYLYLLRSPSPRFYLDSNDL